MAAYVLGLRFATLAGAFRGGIDKVVRTLLWLIVVAGITVLMCWALLSLADADTDVALSVTVLGGSAVTLGFALAPIIGGAGDPLDPRRFAVLGLAEGRLALMLAVAGLIGIPSLALTVVASSAAGMWNVQGVPWTVGAASVVLGVLTCSLLGLVSMALTALLLHERRSRELSGVLLLALLVVIVPIGVFLASLEWGGRVPGELVEVVAVLAVTPIGAAWAYPGLVAAGGDAALSLVVAIATVVALGALWLALVHRLVTTTERPAAVRERGGLGWLALTPGTPGGAIAARSLMYWLRDSRYLVNLAIIPVVALVAIVPLLVAGVPMEIVAIVPAPLIALFLGWLPHNDLAYDSTAVWMHVASGVRGFSDRVGRLVPVLLVGVPLLAIAICVSIAWQGDWGLLPAMIGVCASLYLAGLGLSSISSIVAPYAVSRPGESAFEQPQRIGSGGAVMQALVLAGAVCASLPALWWGWLALQGEPETATVALWGGVAIGVAVLAGGIALGSAAFERRGGRIMEFAEST
ncbi:hypothetical protein AB1K54_14905 [Microbacterium sp. BWT-B31]|uniref:hypothetical protein n=1 Tax=Microbacterium sp. BWT-B31 TaxID=3232072 RepID=UPI003528A19F